MDVQPPWVMLPLVVLQDLVAVEHSILREHFHILDFGHVALLDTLQRDILRITMQDRGILGLETTIQMHWENGGK